MTKRLSPFSKLAAAYRRQKKQSALANCAKLAVEVWELRERLAQIADGTECSALARRGYVNILDVHGFDVACFKVKELRGKR